MNFVNKDTLGGGGRNSRRWEGEATKSQNGLRERFTKTRPWGKLEIGRMMPILLPSWFHWSRSKVQLQHPLLTLCGLHLSNTNCSDKHLWDPELLRATTVPDPSVSLRAWLRVWPRVDTYQNLPLVNYNLRWGGIRGSSSLGWPPLRKIVSQVIPISSPSVSWVRWTQFTYQIPPPTPLPQNPGTKTSW